MIQFYLDPAPFRHSMVMGREIPARGSEWLHFLLDVLFLKWRHKGPSIATNLVPMVDFGLSRLAVKKKRGIR